MDPLQPQEPTQAEPSEELDEALPLDTGFFKKFKSKHHRLQLFRSIVKRRYHAAALVFGIFLCVVGEILLVKQLLTPQPKLQTSHILSNTVSMKVLPPKQGVYLSAYPDFGDSEDEVSLRKIQEYEVLAGKKMFWTYFSNNWYNGISFPKNEVETIHKNGNIPFIRMMPRSMLYETSTEPVLTLKRIAKGDFDTFLKQWGKDAKAYGNPLMVEFGPEVNGDWEPWNGTYNGKTSGPQQFVAAYRHIIDLFRQEGVHNITWVYHITIPSSPQKPWNTYTSYYPGSQYIDWIGVSDYGALSTSENWQSFTKKMDGAYPDLTKVFPGKPIAVLEFGVVDSPEKGNKAQWIQDAFDAIKANKYPDIKAVSYWHATWQQADGTTANTRIDSSPEVLSVFRKEIANDFFIGGVGTISAPRTFDSTTIPDTDTSQKSKTDQPLTASQTPRNSLSAFIGQPWQWQISGQTDESVTAKMYDLDYEKTDAKTVGDLHANGAKVLCYVNAGMWEPDRSDSNVFPKEALGNTVDGSDNKWLDISNFDAIAPIMQKRLDLCKQKGFDGVDPDSIDGYARDTGFSFTADDQLAYNKWLAAQAHARGLFIGLHNDNDQVKDLLGYVDFAITDACIAQNSCDDFNQFIIFGKPVFDAEYTDNGATTDLCSKAPPKFSVIIKHSQLDSFREACQ